MAEMATVTHSGFNIGKKFTSLYDLEQSKKAYETSNFINLIMRDTKTLDKCKSAPKKVTRANEQLVYYYMRLCCTYGGKKFRKRGTGQRDTE